MPRTAVGLALLLTGLGAALPAQRPIVTIASNGIVRVSHRVTLTIPAGRSEHRVVLPGAIAVSVTSATEGVRIVEVRRGMLFDGVEVLRSAVGREFEFARDDGTTVRRRLLGVDPERWSHPGGAIDVTRPGQLLWPADLLVPVDGLLLTLASDRPRREVLLEYEVPGSGWAAVYELRLGTTPTFQGTALLATGALRLDTTTVRLLAGDLGGGARTLPSLELRYQDYSGRGVSGLVPRDQVATKDLYVSVGTSGATAASYVDGVPVASGTLSGQVYRYELPAPVVFKPGREVSVPLLAGQPVAPVRRLSTGGALPPRGEVVRGAGVQAVPVLVSYDLPRRLGTPFGDVPLPAGVVSVLEVGADGVATLAGRTNTPHVAPGSPLSVTLGASFDVTASRVQTDYQVEGRNQQGQAVTVTAAYRLVFRNAGDSTVTVTTYESRLGEWAVLESSHPAERQSSGSVAFAVTVPARGEATLTYRIRAVW